MKKKSFLTIALIILSLSLQFGACGGSGDSGFARPRPQGLVYLQAVTSNSIVVMAESQNESPVVVSYGPTVSYGQSASTSGTKATTGETYMHRILLTDLSPDTLYYYRVGEHRSSFRTAAGGGTEFRFAWMSDSRSGIAVHDQIAQQIANENPRFSLYGGDLCDDGSSYSDYKDQFFRPNQKSLASRVPFFNATGNHEKWETNTKAFLEAPVSSSGNQGYYSFDYGDLHVVVMNYMDPDGYSANSPQYNFIAADLAATTKPWKIVTTHAPAYASGGHGEDEDMIAMTNDIFEPNGVNLVIAGHNHFYQRNYVNGIHHLIIGSAGAPLVEPGPVEGYVQVSMKTHCWAIFDLTPSSLQMRVYNEEGDEIDALALFQ